MENNEQNIPETTLETLARSFFKETLAYGFKQVDYVKFVTFMLDYAMNQDDGETDPTNKTNESDNLSDSLHYDSFPLRSAQLEIHPFDINVDKSDLERWLSTEFGSQFLLSRITGRGMSIGQLIEDETNRVGVIKLQGKQSIGIVAYLGFEQAQGKAELRKMIGEQSMWGRGYGKEATRLWVQYGIHQLQLKKIYLSTLNTNIRNIKLNEDLGFRVEGILRNEVCVDGEYRDVLRMGLWVD